MFLVRLAITIGYGVNIFLTRNCHYIAAAIAFYTLFSFFPLVLAVTFFFQGISENVDELNLAKGIAGVVPVSTGFLVQTVEGVAGSRAVTGSLGLIGLIWHLHQRLQQFVKELIRLGVSKNQGHFLVNDYWILVWQLEGD